MIETFEIEIPTYIHDVPRGAAILPHLARQQVKRRYGFKIGRLEVQRREDLGAWYAAVEYVPNPEEK